MWDRARLASGLSALLLSGCMEALPESVALKPEAAKVEVVSEAPNADVYEPVGEVSAQIIGREVTEVFREACNELRNQAATRQASFVAITDVTSKAAWDMSGRTVMTVTGVAYKPK
ncbi:MAG: hypothetical protein KC657_37855 [Myxococcales bacterium]|nr:hypothetical protein [Myxococcales bacterium]